MKELDKSKIYDLTELNNEELQQVLDFLLTKYENWIEVSFKSFSEGLENVRLAYGYYGWMWVRKGATTNAKELFYTLENVQVDCRYLTQEQIDKMCKVCIKNGYEKGKKELFRINVNHFMLKIHLNKKCYIGLLSGNKTTITYEKFMELFGSEESNFKKLVEVLNEELTEEAYKGTEYEVKYIAEKPKQYQPHYNNENGSLYKIANNLGLNHWEFDIFKRLVRCRKKNQFKEDLQKIKDTIDIYLNEYSE